MSQVELYRSYAEACFRVAHNAVDDAERARWVSTAQHWLQWAQDEESKGSKKDANAEGNEV